MPALEPLGNGEAVRVRAANVRIPRDDDDGAAAVDGRQLGLGHGEGMRVGRIG